MDCFLVQISRNCSTGAETCHAEGLNILLRWPRPLLTRHSNVKVNYFYAFSPKVDDFSANNEISWGILKQVMRLMLLNVFLSESVVFLSESVVSSLGRADILKDQDHQIYRGVLPS